MKTITMYELLGMIKDGKAPKKIKYDNIIWEYDDIYYVTEYTYLDGYCDLSKVLNDEVEILEEEKKIPEKLDTLNYKNRNTISVWNEHRDKINEIIDYLKSKGDK